MSAERLLCAKAIRQVGGEMTLIRAGEGGEERISFTGSLQPRPSEAGPWADPLGVGQEALYTAFIPFGSEGGAMAVGDSIEYRGERYHVQRKETYTLSGAPLYHWAVLRKESGA